MGKKVARDAVLNEHTVKGAEEAQAKWSPPTRVTRHVKETYQIEGYQIPKAVMETALRLANGDISRIQVNKDGSVLVVNQSRRVEVRR